MGDNHHLRCQWMFLAKALYDNAAETPDELSFRRGEVVTVLDQDTQGLEGWWLCSLKGRQGIAPANRLKILSGMGDGGGGGGGGEGDWQRSLERMSSKVMTGSGNRGDLHLCNRSMEDYDVPPSRSSKEPSPEPGHDIYDTPTNIPLSPSTPNSLYATPSGSRRASCERTPPGSQRASMDSLSSGPSLCRRLSGDSDQSPQQYQTLPASRRVPAESRPRRLSAAERLYETPPGSRRASVERTLSDDQPIYDTPTAGGTRPAELPGESTYDTPQPSSRRQSHDSGSRASVMSSASSESGLSGSSSHALPGSKAGSLPDSARSSLDASLHDACDLAPREARALTQLSTDSGLGLYDTPPPPRQQPPSPQPAPFSASVSHSQLSDYAGDRRPSADMKRSRSLEHALDDVYDTPRNNTLRVKLKPEGPPCGSKTAVTPDPHAVYDIPPQVTRDSVISARSDSSDDSVRLSSCSSDSRSSGPEYSGVAEGVPEELLLDLDSALEVLVKRQQEVTRTSARLLAFVTPAWRRNDSLQTHVMDLRMACGDFKKAVGDFVDFAQGAAANAAHLPEKKLMSRLLKQVGPVQQQRKALCAAVRALEDLKWQTSLLADPPESDSQDDLGSVVSLAQDVVPPVKKLASFIQTNSAALFKRSSDGAGQSRGAEDSHVVSKPPAGPKSELLLPKSGRGGGTGVGIVIQRPRSVQQRPLPAPPLPLSERPLPPTPLQQRLRDLELAGALDNLTDYINLHGRAPAAGDRDYSDLQQDYDYVQIETCDAQAQQQRKNQQNLKAHEDDLDTPKTPTPDTFQDSEKLCEDDSDVRMKPDPHAESVYSDIDRVPSRDKPLSVSQSNEDSAEGELNGQPDSPEEDLKTPMNTVNGFTIPDHQYSSGYVDVNQTSLTANDKQVLVYYSGQLETHSTLLNNAVDAFFSCIENSEPPKVFISNSKFVIVTAHKLVYISDALHRNLMNCAVRNKVMQCANHLCQCLKVSVQATKTAALQYPSVPAVQDMVDRVVDVSHAAHELKLVITQAAAL